MFWKILSTRRSRTLEKNLLQPRKAQEEVLKKILDQVKGCKIAADLRLDGVRGMNEFLKTVPVTEYDFYQNYISEILKGKRDILFQGRPVRIAQTGGTTAKPKLLPLSRHLIWSYRQFNLDMALRYMVDSGNHDIFSDKIFLVAANPESVKMNGCPVGFITGIMAQIAPWILRRRFVPGMAVIKNPKMQQKIEQISQEGYIHRNRIHMAAGLTTYLMSAWNNLIRYAHEIEGRDYCIGEIFPHLKVAFHGGSTYGLYLERMRALAGSRVDHRNVYSAAEGPIAFQFGAASPGLAPALDAVFFEFIPAHDAEKEYSDTVMIDEVECGKPYYLLLSTQGGLLRYKIGDMVEFIQNNPPLLSVLGKTSDQIDLSAEKMGVAQATLAIQKASLALNLNILNFMVCPKAQIHRDDKIAHEWIIEFESEPKDLQAFRDELEKHLFSCNPLYQELRNHDFALASPQITVVPAGTFQRYIEGEFNYGQQKILHMHNDRSTAEMLLSYGR